MKKKTRRILFLLSVLVFIVLSFSVLFFALGYRYDFVQNKFLKTGSLELKINVSADVYINEGLAGSTSFLGNSFSRGQLLPHTYDVRIQNDKYQSWHKLVKIEGGFLTSFPRIVLLPQDLGEVNVASSSIRNISIERFEPDSGLAIIGNKQKLESINLESGEVKTIKFLPSPVSLGAGSKKDQLIFVESPDNNKDAWFNGGEVWVKWVKDSGYQPLKKAGDTELVARFLQPIEDVQWFKDSEHLIASVGGILKFTEIDNRGDVNIFDISTVSGPFYYDRNQDAVFKFEGNKLVRINLSK